MRKGWENKSSNNTSTHTNPLDPKSKTHYNRTTNENHRDDIMVNVLILYYSRGGHTDTLAKAIAKGVEKVDDAKPVLKRVDYATGIELIESDAVALGTPNYFGYMAGIMKDYFDRTVGSRAKVEGKPAAAFSSGSGSSTGALDSLEKMITSFKLNKVAEGLVSEGEPTGDDLAKCVEMGTKLATEAAKKSSDPQE